MARPDAHLLPPMTPKYHDGPTTLRQIADMHDVALVRTAIEIEYGFTPTEEYCRDLIAFVEALDTERQRLRQLETVCQTANDTLCAIDLWLGMASTRQAADDSIWRLHRMLQQAGWDYDWRHYLEWRRAMLHELNSAGFFVGDDGLFHYDPTADKEKPYRVYGNAVGPTIAQIVKEWHESRNGL